MHPDDKFLSAFVLIFALLVFGTFAYNIIEGWTYVDSLYFTAMTVTTVGYGDLVPSTDASKLFTVFFSLTGISIVLVIMVTIGGDYYKKERRAFGYRINQYLEAKKLRNALRKRRATIKFKKRKKTRSSKRRNIFNWGR